MYEVWKINNKVGTTFPTYFIVFNGTSNRFLDEFSLNMLGHFKTHIQMTRIRLRSDTDPELDRLKGNGQHGRPK